MLEIDGSFGEGGGQILRSCLALSGVLGKEVRIFNIRAGRSEPGLKAQHLTGAKALETICNASSKVWISGQPSSSSDPVGLKEVLSVSMSEPLVALPWSCRP